MTDDIDELSTSRRRWPLILGAVLFIIAGLAIGVWALLPPGGAQSSPSGAATASSSASPSPTASLSGGATPSGNPSGGASPDEKIVGPTSPLPGAPTISSFVASTETVACADERAAPVPLSFSWSSSEGTRAWIAEGSTDASVAPFAEVPLSASDYSELSYDCREAEQLFTLTVEGSAGRTSASFSVSRDLG